MQKHLIIVKHAEMNQQKFRRTIFIVFINKT